MYIYVQYVCRAGAGSHSVCVLSSSSSSSLHPHRYRYTKVEIITRDRNAQVETGVNTYFRTSLDQQGQKTQTSVQNRYHNVNPGKWHQKIESYFSRVKYRYQNVWAGILPLGASTLSPWHEVTRYMREYMRLVPYENTKGE